MRNRLEDNQTKILLAIMGLGIYLFKTYLNPANPAQGGYFAFSIGIILASFLSLAFQGRNRILYWGSAFATAMFLGATLDVAVSSQTIKVYEAPLLLWSIQKFGVSTSVIWTDLVSFIIIAMLLFVGFTIPIAYSLLPDLHFPRNNQ